MQISSAGIGSGLDVASIVEQLMAFESRPLVRLQSKQIAYEAQISAFGQLRSSIADFQLAAEKLSTLSALDIYSSTSSKDSVVTASTVSGAELGNYGIEVVRLAENHKMAATEVAATATFGGTAGDLVTVQVGSDVANIVTVDMTTAMTYAQIRDAINDDANNPGVTATIITGNSGNQKLILTADDSGEVSALTVTYGGTVNLGFATLNNIGGDLSLLDAEINVDGFNISRSTNTIDDVIDGVTLNLFSADPGNTHTINVDRNTSAITSLVQTFADTFDSLRAEIKIQRSGQLRADSVLSQLDRQLTRVLNTAATAGTFSYLTEVGATLQQDGTMSLDTSILNAALASDFDNVAQLFAADGDGFASRFFTFAEDWLASDGLLEARTDGLSARINDLVDQQLSVQRNLVIIEARLRAEFSALDVLVGQISSTSNFLETQLVQLPGAFSFRS